MKVKWKQGSHFKVTAGVAYTFFEDIRIKNDGVINWEAAEEMSRPKNAPLHDDLEWDDAVCGLRYRIGQLQRMVRNLVYQHRDMQTTTRVYEQVRLEAAPVQPAQDGKSPEAIKAARVFMRAEDLLADPAARADLLGQAIRDILAYRRRYAALSELANLISVIDEEVKKLA